MTPRSRPRLALVLLLALPGLMGAAPAAPPPAPRTPTRADARIETLARDLKAHLGGPEALVDLVHLHGLVDQVTRLPRLAQVLHGAAVSRKAEGEVRAYARLCLAEVEWRRGRRPQAERWIRSLGLVTRGLMVGPFPNDNGAAYDEVLPPEKAALAGTAPDAAQAWPGKNRPVRWRVLPGVFPLGYVDLSSLVSPSNQVALYVRVVLEAPKDLGAVLRIGTPGATKVWVDGKPVHADPDDHPPRLDQAAIPVVLHAGDNPVLLKITQQTGLLGYFLRVTDADGNRLRGVTVLDPKTDLAQGTAAAKAAAKAAPAGTAAAGAGPEPGHQSATVAAAEVPAKGKKRRHPVTAPTPKRVLDQLLARAKKSPKDAAALGDAAEALHHFFPFDRTDRRDLAEAKAAEAVADPKDPASARYPLLVAAYETDANRRRLALEQAVARDPHSTALVSLAAIDLQQGYPRKALARLRLAVHVHPDDVQAQLLTARAEGDAGFSEDREQRIHTLLGRFPLDAKVLRAAASVDRAHDRVDAALRHLRVATALYPADPRLRNDLMGLMLRLGNLEGAVDQLEALERFDPANLYPYLRLADLLSANGHPRRADKVFARALAIAPDNAGVYFARARSHLRHGNREAALADLERASTLRPQDTDISTLRHTLEKKVADFAEPYRADLAKVVKAAARAKAPKNADLWTLEDLTVVRVHPNGLQSRIVQVIRKALTHRGVEQLRSFSVSYTPGSQELRVLQARVMKPDGTVVQARSEGEQNLSEPWYQTWYDLRARIIAFPDVHVGDTVEVSYRLDDVAAANMFGNYFGDLDFLQDTSPIADEQYVLIGPPGRTFYFNHPSLAGLTHEVEKTPAGAQVLRWRVHDVPAIVPEAHMPGWTEVAPYLHISTYEDYGQVARWWWQLIKDQLVPTPDLVKLAQSLVEGIPKDDLRARVTAIYHYVVTKTRYVALEFGIHGFKPYRVDQINQRRFGDCKDKASLMYALLKAIGIPSDPVIVRTRDLGSLPPHPASLAVFNHAILYVPKLELFLDGTAEMAGTKELPSMDRGATVLVVDPTDPGASHLGTIPFVGPSANHSSTQITFTLDAKGNAVAQGSYSIQGNGAYGYRQAYQAADQRRTLFEQSWSGSFPGAKVTKLSMPDLEDLEKPVTADFTLDIPRLATPTGGDFVFTPFGGGRTYTDRYAPLSSRHYDLILPYPFESHFGYTVKLPAGWQVDGMPAASQASGPFGHFAIDWKRTPDGLVASGTVVLSVTRVKVKDYPAFRAFLGKIDRAEAARVTLVPARTADATPAAR